MTSAPEPPNEARRVEALRRYGILDSEPEAAFDDLVFLASQACGCELAYVSFVDAGREWLKSAIGFAPKVLPREVALCAHTILGRELLIVPDARLDPRFADNPLVTGPPGLRFYAGAPIFDPEGFALGALCVAGLEPRELQPSQQRALAALARQVEQQLELRLHVGGATTRVAEALAEARRSDAARNAVYRISEAAQSAPGLAAFLAQVHEAIRALMPAENFYIALLDASGRKLSFPYFVDRYDPPPPVQPLGSGLTEYVIRTGKPLLAAPEVFQDLVSDRQVALVGSPSIDWLGVPLDAAGRTIGALVVQSYDEGKRYRREDLDLLSFVSGQVALAVRRKQAEESRLDSEARIRLLMAQLPAILWTTDRDLRFTSSEGSGLEALGLRPGEVVGQTLQEFFATESEEFSSIAAHLRALEGEASSFEQVWGERRFAVRVDALRNTEGAVSGVIGLAIDVSERWELEERLRLSLRLEAIGQLAGGVAHDFNNLLTSILGNSELLLERLPRGDRSREEVEEIRAAGERAASLTQQLLVFGRRQLLEPRVLELNSLVTDAARMLRRLIDENIELALDLDSAAGSVLADSGQMLQVIVNLAVNARDAMPAGGKLEIATRALELDSSRRFRLFEIPPGSWSVLRVSDTGTGIPPEVRAHIFEPFFTTKGQGKGTGLGLASVYGVVKQSDGYITVESAPGAGSTFLVYLPRIDAAPESQGAEEPPAERARGTETILVVEDEASVRTLARRMLEARGYRVLVAANGESALEIERAHAGEIDLLLTDVVMPGLSGPELAERLGRRRPGTRILFVSGYPEDSLGERGVLRQGTAFLQKPFSSAALAQKIAEVLDAPPPGANV